MESDERASRDLRLKAHARQLRTHVDSLPFEAYWERFSPTPEFVVCFVPADAFLDAALREDPSLLEHAFARNVVIATPSPLMALLHHRLRLAPGSTRRERQAGTRTGP